MRIEIIDRIAAAKSIGAIGLSHGAANESTMFGINPHPGSNHDRMRANIKRGEV
jgi:hypothetical protein